MSAETLRNIDTDVYKVKVAFRKHRSWRTEIFEEGTGVQDKDHLDTQRTRYSGYIRERKEPVELLCRYGEVQHRRETARKRAYISSGLMQA